MKTRRVPHNAWTAEAVMRVLAWLRRFGPPDGFAATSGGVPAPDRGPIGATVLAHDMACCTRVLAFADVARAVQDLPDQIHHVARLYYLGGDAPTQAEVAGALGISQQRVSELLREAREAIVQQLVYGQ